MSGAVGSIPSLTRSGRPSASFRSSSPSGRTSTALRRRDRRPPRAADCTRSRSSRRERHESGPGVPECRTRGSRAERRRERGRPARGARQREPEAGRHERHRDRGEERRRARARPRAIAGSIVATGAARRRRCRRSRGRGRSRKRLERRPRAVAVRVVVAGTRRAASGRAARRRGRRSARRPSSRLPLQPLGQVRGKSTTAGRRGTA